MTERARQLVLTAATVLVTLVLIFATTSVAAQQTTERYIPIGQSPGVSGKYSYIGEIVAMDGDTITVAEAAERHTIKLTEQTDIWIDRNKSLQRNLVGTRSDCRVGRLVEVMHTAEDDNTAKWVKIAE